MNNQDELVQVYTGSVVESNYIKELLEENGIGAMVRDTLSESMVAGWASGAPEDSALVFVARHDEVAARKFIGEYKRNKG